MEDILRDYGLRPQGKSAPMGSSKSLNTTTSSFSFNFNTVGGLNNYNNKKSSPSLNPVDDIFSTTANQGTSTYNSSDTDFSAVYDDVFSGPAQPKTSHSTMGYNDIFQSFSSPTKPSSAPLSGAPRYDDDIFGGVQGVKSSNTMPYDDVFASVGGSAASPGRDSFDDLLGGFSAKEPAAKPRSPSPPAKGNSAFDDLLPGFGKSEPAEPRGTAKTKFQQPSDSSQKPATDPFVVLEADSFSSNASSATFHDPLEEFGMPTESASMNDRKSSTNGTIGIDDIFDGFSQSVPLASSPINNFGKDQSPLKTDRISSPPRTKDSREAVESKSPKIASANNLEKNHAKIYSSDPMADFDIPSGIADASIKSTSDTNKHSLHEDSTFASNLNSKEASSPGKPNDSSEIVYDRWITVDDIQLFTQPTSAPPPSRLPPPLVIKQGPSKSYREAFGSEKPSVISSIDELEEFAMGRSQGYAQQKEGISSFEEDIGSNSAAAAMKEAMDKAEAKLKTAKKVREKEKEEDMVKARQSERQEREERPVEEVAEREEKESVARVAREAREREEREKEERERERLRTEKERERRAFDYVILGGGVSAGYAALEFVKQGINHGELCIISQESVAPYERPALSKGFLLPEDAARLPHFHTCVGSNEERLTPKWYKEHGIELVLGTHVKSADVKRKTLLTAAGETITFKILIVATGARVLKLEEFGVNGSDAKNICYLRDLNDATKLVNVMASCTGANAVVIGGGYIGMECAAALVTNKIHVTMVFPEEHLMARLFTSELAAFYEDYYRSKGVRFIKGTVMSSFERDSEGKVVAVILKNGIRLATDMVVVGIGIRANTGLFEDQLVLEKGGIKVNGKMQTSNGYVYAVGDMAAFPLKLSGELRRLEHVDFARKSARHAIKAIMAPDKINDLDYLPYFYSRVFTLSWQFYGDNFGDPIHFGDPKQGKFGTYWVDRGQLVGVFLEGGSKDEYAALENAARIRPLIEDKSVLSSQGVEFALSLKESPAQDFVGVMTSKGNLLVENLPPYTLQVTAGVFVATTIAAFAFWYRRKQRRWYKI